MEIRRCMKCLHELRADETVCPECGREYGTSRAEHFALRPGTILDGKYLVGEMLGQGGFGITYVGFDLLLEQKVAIKEYFPMSTGMVSRDNQATVVWSSAMMSKTGTERGFESFLKEARKMAKLGSIPGVVDVKTVFIQNETAYIVMDYVEGETLLSKLQREGPMTFAQCVRLLTPVIEALNRVNANGIIHRDISPDNIMMQPDGSLVLLDLGAAKDLEIKNSDGTTQHSSQLVAKHGFSPYEQYTENGSIGSWTDVYAMCATIYYCCTRQVPPSAIERGMEDLLSCQPLLTEAEFRILEKGMAVKAKNRYQTMKELLTALNGTPDDASEKRKEAERRKAEETEKKREEEKQKQEEMVRRQQELQRRLEESKRRDEEARRTEEKEDNAAKKKLQKKWFLPAIAAVVLVLALVVYNKVVKPTNQYNQAVSLMEKGEYQAAVSIFEKLDGYKDSAEQIEECRHLYAQINLSDFKYHSTYAYSDDPADDALYTAAEFANVVKSENVRDQLPLGTRIKMIPQSSKITDTAIEFELVAYQHFPLAEGTGMAKTTWLAVNALSEGRKMNTGETNGGGWRDSDLRQWMNEALYPSLPSYWKGLIEQVEVSSTAGKKSQEIVTSKDYLFLPAVGEVNNWHLTSSRYSEFNKKEIPSGADEQTFTCFTDDASRVKKRNRRSTYWWLRSPAAGSSTGFYIVSGNGGSNNFGANSSIGVCPGFCM